MKSNSLSISICLFGALLLLFSVTEPAHARGDKVTIQLIPDGKPDPADTSVTGYLFRPDEGTGQFPAVILLHGCDGLGWQTPRQGGWKLMSGYAERFSRLGYVALVLDSFEPRGIKGACGKPLTVSPDRRAWDALSAMRFLVNQHNVDPTRVVLEGHSHGAVAVLVAMERDRWRVPEHFAGGIAWYPGCSWNKVGFTAPVLILIGEVDDWTTATECRNFVARLAATGEVNNVDLRVYPGATHAFDAPGGVRYAYGHRIQHDTAAATDAWAQVEAFLRSNLNR